MTVTVSIDIGNSAMSEPEHVAAALQAVARDIEHGVLVPGWWGRVRDENGNTVGRFEVTAK